MSIQLNKKALEHARKLVEQGKVVRDERDDWSEHAPSADDENRFIEKNGWDEYALWHLGEDPEKSEETKGRFSFPTATSRRCTAARSSRWRAAPPRTTTTTSPARRSACST